MYYDHENVRLPMKNKLTYQNVQCECLISAVYVHSSKIRRVRTVSQIQQI